MSKNEKVEQAPGPIKPADNSVEGFQHPQQVEPRTLNTTRFLQYKSLELKKLNNTFLRFKNAGPYLGIYFIIQLDALFSVTPSPSSKHQPQRVISMVLTETEETG